MHEIYFRISSTNLWIQHGDNKHQSKREQRQERSAEAGEGMKRKAYM